jgi:hypothetical protein
MYGSDPPDLTDCVFILVEMERRGEVEMEILF